MKQLRDKVAEKTNVKQSSDYINDSTEHQRVYDQALQEKILLMKMLIQH